MTMKLYEMTEELAALIDTISALIENDEMEPSAKEMALEALKLELGKLSGTHAEKCLNLACLIKNVEAEAEAIAAEEKRLNVRRRFYSR